MDPIEFPRMEGRAMIGTPEHDNLFTHNVSVE